MSGQLAASERNDDGIANGEIGRCETLWTANRSRGKVKKMKPTNTGEDYYVYCYIDPRNLEIFYYGKGTGGRSESHLLAQGKSEMAARIKQIRAAGVEPIIRIIAADLTKDQALLVEAAFIWKSGRQLVNVVSGHYTDKFRPKDTLHKKLAGFDFSNRIHVFNVGEGKNQEWEEYRSWDDCYTHGFLSTGYGLKHKKKAEQLNKSDVVLAYISGKGYVGIGKVTAPAVPARKFRIGKKRLNEMSLHAKEMCHDPDDLNKCEYVIKVEWLVKKKREDALKKPGLFIPQSTRVEMTNQPKTLSYIEQEWGKELGKSFEEILEDESS